MITQHDKKLTKILEPGLSEQKLELHAFNNDKRLQVQL